MARNPTYTLRELGRNVTRENGGVIAERGTFYPCTQEQIDDYTLETYCRRGTDHIMSEFDAIRMLEDFLDPRRPPTTRVRAALHRLYDAMTLDHAGPDIVIKAVHDIDTAFFMGRLKGNVSIRWVNRLMEATPISDALTYPLDYGCSAIYLSLEAIFRGEQVPQRDVWQTVFHELIHAFVLATRHDEPPSSYDRAQGWTDGHGYMFRRCLLALEERTKEYFDGFCIASPDDIIDYRTLRSTRR